jgi:hypothetical protein
MRTEIVYEASAENPKGTEHHYQLNDISSTADFNIRLAVFK